MLGGTSDSPRRVRSPGCEYTPRTRTSPPDGSSQRRLGHERCAGRLPHARRRHDLAEGQHRDENSGAMDLVLDPANPAIHPHVTRRRRELGERDDRDLPEFALISILEPSAHDPTPRRGSRTRTTTSAVSSARTPSGPGSLYAGTEHGLYVSFDAGDSRQPLSLNLPVVPIHDLALRDGDLAAATHECSFWILDEVALLHQLVPGEAANGARLFRPRPTTCFNKGAAQAAMLSVMGRSGAGESGPRGSPPHAYSDEVQGLSNVTRKIRIQPRPDGA